MSVVKRVLVGRPLATSESDHQRIPKVIALAVFSSDAISSTAYAAEEILFVTALGGSSLDKGLSVLVPIGIAVALLLTIVVVSYRQTIFAYPSGGGSYVVSRENLGEKPSLLAGASLLIDYILTVAVSISAGVAAIVSIPAFKGLASQRVPLGLLLIALITIVNLRGVKESGKVFAGPTYVYIAILTLLVVWGLSQVFFGDLGHIEFDPQAFEGAREAGGNLSLFLILKGFSSGAVALTGVEAISNGVPAFRRNESKNAAATLVAMGLILGTLFFGTAVLAHHLRPFPSRDETVFSQMGRFVFGNGPLYLVLQFATAGILTLAANTAYADFPRLSSIIAKDGYLPRQFANRGDRLVFSNGVVFLAVAAGALLVAFGGTTNALIPLYAIGVFTSFTLSQMGMVRHHQRLREPRWQLNAVINGIGAVATFIVLLIVASTKFTSGAWVPIVVVPIVMTAFIFVAKHYRNMRAALDLEPDDVRPRAVNHTVVVLVSRLHKGVLRSLEYAKSMRPTHLTAVHVADDDEATDALQREWVELGIEVPLEAVNSPYRDLVSPVEAFLDELEERWDDDTITVLIPEFVVDHWYENILHNQTALTLKLALLQRPGTVVTSVPYHVSRKDLERGAARLQASSGPDRLAARPVAGAPGPPGDNPSSRAIDDAIKAREEDGGND
ncbi:MAG: APC family permease [Acidimicrobiales bacterium]